MAKPEHLGMIQAVIGRLAGNSFVVKGWSITLTAALLGFAAKDNDASFAWIAFGAAAAFSLVDARYLALERKYVELYNATIKPGAAEDWNLKADTPGFGDIMSALMSWSVATVHGATIVAALGVALYG